VCVVGSAAFCCSVSVECLLLKSEQQSPCLEAGQEIPRISWNPEVCNFVRKIVLFVLFLFHFGGRLSAVAAAIWVLVGAAAVLLLLLSSSSSVVAVAVVFVFLF
jgi:hypothetical protein